MGVASLVSRGVQRLQSVGPRRFVSFLFDRYVDPVTEQYLFAGRPRRYEIGRTYRISIPVFNADELQKVFDDLRSLSESSHGAKDIEATIVMIRGAGDTIQPPHVDFPVHIDRVETPRLVLSVVLWAGHIYIPEYIEPQRAAELRETLDKLGMHWIVSREELCDAYRKRTIVQLVGPGRHTRFLYSALQRNLDGVHYGYREQIDLDLIKKLPEKYDFFSKYCEVNYVPIRDLNRYPGRVSRQYVVGDMYAQPYLSTKSVLDIGCDIRGISERVGHHTKYVGVDIQGLGDYLLDLDKEDLPFEDRSFDTVLCFEVLEHLNRIHECFDRMLSISEKYFIGSLFIESGVWGGRSINRFGDSLGNMHLPIAPTFDRHEWIFSANDALDFIYYRAGRSGFDIIRLDLFYDDIRPRLFQVGRLKRAFRKGDVRYLSKEVLMIGFVLQRRA